MLRKIKDSLKLLSFLFLIFISEKYTETCLYLIYKKLEKLEKINLILKLWRKLE